MIISEEVKQRLDIASVISEHVALTKTGRNLRGLCPFHTEKTPSFFVFPERQTWRCFGCGVGGDVISFVMKKEAIGFAEAIKKLAPRAGVSIPEKREKSLPDERLVRMYRINEKAAERYHQLLLTSPAAAAARDYVSHRGLSEATVEEFQLGFSLDSWDDTRKHLKQAGYEDAELVAAGLLVEKENRTYDRFRGRLMFPIRDEMGRTIGFGARALDKSEPKYLNSSESPIFSKGSVLYGIDLARTAIRQQGKVVIVEGYMDAIMAHQHGFKNVVASMGTALTEKQIAILKAFTTHFCLSLDADTAGNAATLRGIDICRTALTQESTGMKGWLGKSTVVNARIDVLSLPEGKDPDDVIRQDPGHWRKLVEEARPLIDHLLAATARDFDLTRLEGRSGLAERFLPLVTELPDSAEREHYLTKLAGITGLSDEVLRGKIADQTAMKGPKKIKTKTNLLPSSSKRFGDQTEEYCLSLLLQHPRLRGMAADLAAEHFERTENQEIFAAWRTNAADEDVEASLDAHLIDHLRSLTDRQIPPLDNRGQEKALMDCVRRLKQRTLRARCVFEAESALEEGANQQETSARLSELQREHSSLSE